MSSRKGRSYDDVSAEQDSRPLLNARSSSKTFPAFLTRHARRSPLTWRLIRLLIWAAGVATIFCFASGMLRSETSPTAINYLSTDGEAYEVVSSDNIPEYATPLVVTEKRGRSRWTVSIPPGLEFPLKPIEYSNLCTKSVEMAQEVSDLKHKNSKHHHNGHRAYNWVDPTFMDVAEAEEHGLLPGWIAAAKKDIWGKAMGNAGHDSMSEDLVTMQGEGRGQFCERTLTYVMETGDAGMGSTLLGLWMSYGLAQKEGRAFFIDDTHWAYGNYTTFFKPPPKPNCLPPPRTQILPCPHHARHLLVSSGTVPHTFGAQFHDFYEDARKMEVYRLKQFFDFLRTGYEALFDLQGDDGDYLAARADYLNSTIRGSGGLEVAIHVRHGDNRPLEYQYRKSYLPLSIYVDAARDILNTTFGTATADDTEDFPSEMSSKMLLASDDPDVYLAPELAQALKAQDRITLGSKTSLDQPSAPGDANLGFEGGFFHDVFWSLGAPSRPIPPGSPAPSKRMSVPQPPQPRSADHRHPSPEALEVRGLIGRAYLLDLAVLGQADRVVCGVSSNTCRILAVMMGWERAVEAGEWVNVDGDFGWSDIAW